MVDAMEISPDITNQGQIAFTKNTLAVYDWMVLGLACHLIWRCPNERILAFYRAHLSGNHLEVGVGTGFFLDRSTFPTVQPRLALLDLNRNCLERTAQRLAHYQPTIYQANILNPIEIQTPAFNSVCLNYVLHCLPGSFPEKGKVFAHLRPLLKPGGVLFGATVLHGGVQRNAPARLFMRWLNTRQVFSNARDDRDGLVVALEQHLSDVQVHLVGCVALFSGRV